MWKQTWRQQQQVVKNVSHRQEQGLLPLKATFCAQSRRVLRVKWQIWPQCARGRRVSGVSLVNCALVLGLWQ